MDVDMFNIVGKCRFCQKEGLHRDIMKDYDVNGIREIYFDIIQECFNLYLCIVSNQSRLICITCVQQLRDANSFRGLVVKAEQDLLEATEQDPVFVNISEKWSDQFTVDVKTQDTVKSEHDTGSSLDDDLQESIDNDICWPNVKTEIEPHISNNCNTLLDKRGNCSVSRQNDTIQGEAELLSRFRNVKLLPNRNSLYKICYKYATHLDALKGKKITSANIKNSPLKDRACSTEKSELLHNIMQLLQHSNMAPFIPKRRSGILCYYCFTPFDSLTSIHDHQAAQNCKRQMAVVLNKKCSETLVIYTHISDLQCTICNATLDFNALKNHLVTVHKKNFYPHIGDRVVPFKSMKGNEFKCQICGFSFETFGSIERHMNTHFRNFICECGAGYMTKSRLKVHWKYSHENGVFPCEICKKVFPSQHKYNCHHDRVHRSVKKNKCTKCPARFADYFNKHKHMVDVHGEPPLEYRCNVCDAVFRRRYSLLCHVRRRHLEAKAVSCELCSYKCYTSTELRVHMIKHVGERTYQCGVCKKAYARKKTLKEHMRIHANDRRFVCAICGQGFVQNCSLKGHMRTHHADCGNDMG